jgi:hypothetical protein
LSETEIIDHVKQQVKAGTPLTDDDRVKFANAAKNAVAIRRQELKHIAQAQWKELVAQNTHELVFYKEYKTKVRMPRAADQALFVSCSICGVATGGERTGCPQQRFVVYARFGIDSTVPVRRAQSFLPQSISVILLSSVSLFALRRIFLVGYL